MKVLVSLAIIAVIAASCVEASPRFHGTGRHGDHEHGRGHRFQHALKGNRCDLRNTTLNEVKEVVITKIDQIVTKNSNLTDSGNVITEAVRNGSLDTVILHQINGTQATVIENEAGMGNADTPVQEEDLVDTDIGDDTSIQSSSSNAGAGDLDAEIEDADDNTEGTLIVEGRKENKCCFFKLLKAFSKVDGELGIASQNILDSIKSKDYRRHRGGGGRRHHGRRHGHRHAAAHHHQQSHRYSRRNEPGADQEGYQNAENIELASP